MCKGGRISKKKNTLLVVMQTMGKTQHDHFERAQKISIITVLNIIKQYDLKGIKR